MLFYLCKSQRLTFFRIMGLLALHGFEGLGLWLTLNSQPHPPASWTLSSQWDLIYLLRNCEATIRCFHYIKLGSHPRVDLMAPLIKAIDCWTNSSDLSSQMLSHPFLPELCKGSSY